MAGFQEGPSRAEEEGLLTGSLSGADFLAPRYVVAVDEKIERQGRGGLAAFDWRTLDAGAVLPAFGSLELFLDFVGTYYAVEGEALPVHVKVDAFGLSRVLGHLEPAGVRSVVIDPVATAAGRWSDPRETMTLTYYRRFVEEMRPGLDGLFAEAAARLGGSEGWRTPQNMRRLEGWCAPRIEEVAKDAHARAGEWIARVGS